MTEEQYVKLQQYIRDELNQPFSVDERDYSVDDVREEMLVTDIPITCEVFIECNGIVTSRLARFQGNCWRWPVVRNGLVTNELAPIHFTDSYHYLGYIPRRKPFDGEIEVDTVSDILSFITTRFPDIKFNIKKKDGKINEISFRDSGEQHEKYVIHKGCGRFMDVVGTSHYYQAKIKDILEKLIDKLVHANTNKNAIL